jgi:predicted enzyme related to lactoylglutathione lyase
VAPAFGGFSWHELATTDVAAALRFYGELFGWNKGVGHDMGAMGVYQLFEHGGMAVGGMCNTQGPSTPPSWLSYVHVADSSRAVGAVKSAGGRLLHGPVEVPGGSWIALFLDPQGGAFAVHEMPRATSRPAAAGTAAPTAAQLALKLSPSGSASSPAAARKKAAKKKAAARKSVAKKKKAPARAARKSARKAKKVVRRAKKTVRRAKRVVRRVVRRAARKKK